MKRKMLDLDLDLSDLESDDLTDPLDQVQGQEKQPVVFLGEGTYADVYAVGHDAIKIIKDTTSMTSFLQESSIMQQLHHPQVLQARGVSYGSNSNTLNLDRFQYPSITMDIQDGTLDDEYMMDFLQNEEHLRLILYQIVRGLAYCHGHGIWHLDLSPWNILYNHNDNRHFPTIKLADFGLSKTHPRSYQVDDVKFYWYNVQSYVYRAPEVCLQETNDPITEKVDCWSLGVIICRDILGFDYIDQQVYEDDLENLTEDQYYGAGTNSLLVTSIPLLRYMIEAMGQPDPIKHPSTYQAWQSTERRLQDLSEDIYFTQEPSTLLLPTSSTHGHSMGNLHKFTDSILDEELKELIHSLLVWSDERLDAEQLLRLPYFSSIKEEVEHLWPAVTETTRPVRSDPVISGLYQSFSQFLIEKDHDIIANFSIFTRVRLIVYTRIKFLQVMDHLMTLYNAKMWEELSQYTGMHFIDIYKGILQLSMIYFGYHDRGLTANHKIILGWLNSSEPAYAGHAGLYEVTPYDLLAAKGPVNEQQAVQLLQASDTFSVAYFRG